MMDFRWNKLRFHHLLYELRPFRWNKSGIPSLEAHYDGFQMEKAVIPSLKAHYDGFQMEKAVIPSQITPCDTITDEMPIPLSFPKKKPSRHNLLGSH
jgi:hypothetical protein